MFGKSNDLIIFGGNKNATLFESPYFESKEIWSVMRHVEESFAFSLSTQDD